MDVCVSARLSVQGLAAIEHRKESNHSNRTDQQVALWFALSWHFKRVRGSDPYPNLDPHIFPPKPVP